MKIKNRFLALFLSAVCLILCLPSVKGRADEDFPFIGLESYSITNEKIIPGKDFTITLNLVNSSAKKKANNVVIAISNPSGILPKYGQTSQAFIKSVEKGESFSVDFEFSSIEEIYAYYEDFAITIFSDESNNEFVLRIPVGTDSPFSIQSVSVPESAMEGYSASATATFKVIGIDGVKNVVLVAYVDGKDVARTSIGSLTPGTSKSQNITIPFTKAGNANVVLKISYEDVTGRLKEAEIANETIAVTDNSWTAPDPIDDKPSLFNKKVILGAGGIIFLVFASVVYALIKKKR